MKIIISPSKTMSIKKLNFKSETNFFYDKYQELVNIIKKLSIEELSALMKIKDKKLDEVFNFYKDFNKDQGHAIASYTGLVFKGLDIDNYNDSQLNYINDNITILCALYGAIKPFNLISNYRLDMTMKPSGINLYKYHEINDFINDELIINLASNEFSKMIKHNMVTIHFREFDGTKYKNVPTYSKKSRGIMLDYLIKNNITKVCDIKKFNKEGYSFNESLSNEYELTFTR